MKTLNVTAGVPLWQAAMVFTFLTLSQVKVSYIPKFYQSPLKHLFSYYYTIFKLILFQYDTSLSNNNFVVLLISVVNVDFSLKSRHLWRHGYTRLVIIVSILCSYFTLILKSIEPTYVLLNVPLHIMHTHLLLIHGL